MSWNVARPSLRWRAAFFIIPLIIAVLLPGFLEHVPRLSRVSLGIVAGLISFAVLFGIQQWRDGGRYAGS